MSLDRLGEGRSRRALDHLVQTPGTFVWAPLPGMVGATACVHAAPALGAGFVQYTVAMEPGGRMQTTRHSRFAFGLEGAVELMRQGERRELRSGDFACLPPGDLCSWTAGPEGARMVVVEKPYTELVAGQRPPALFGSAAETAPAALLGDEAIQVRSLLGSDPLLDFAVNVMEYRPGARLSMVEVHVMEHGLLMLEGEGIYRLGDAWYPVAAGDFIWMAPFCPQWFGALGAVPAKYLIYKDWNRHPDAAGMVDGR